MNEIWVKIQSSKLHKDPRVLSSNLNAAKKVSDLTLLFIAIPNLIEESFRKEHFRLEENNSNYIEFYRNFCRKKPGKAPSITVEAGLFNFLPLERMIGEELNIKPTVSQQEVKVYDIILAKDYVASLTDSKIDRIYKKSFFV